MNFENYLHDLCSNVSNSIVHDGDVTVTVEAEPVNIEIDRAIPLGMVVNELVTNAVKYAYGPREKGDVDVRFSREDAGGLALTVSDARRGLPSEADGKPIGLGLTMVRGLLAQVGGTLTVDRAPGARFTIRFPERASQGQGPEQAI